MPIRLWTCVPEWFKGLGEVKAYWSCDGHQSSWEPLGPESIYNRPRSARANEKAHLLTFVSQNWELEANSMGKNKEANKETNKKPKTNMTRHIKRDLPKKSKYI